MSAIMENRKRQCFEMINIDSNNSNESIQGVASSATAMGTATVATIGGQSFILSNSSATPIPANILLSICDVIEDESAEYILDHPLLSTVKQEHTVSTQTNNNKIQQQQQSNVVNSAPQYRIINPVGKSLNATTLNSAVIHNTASNSNNSLLANGLNFPPGCEIYVVKEVFDEPEHVIDESEANNITSPKIASSKVNTIKEEPISPLPAQHHSILNGTKRQNLNSNSTNTTNANSTVTSTSNASSTFSNETTRHSIIFDNYKKRDDQRRAIHNEVERRRRDKINSWIFKLKELMPSEQQGIESSTRTPSNNSKSQILIKACEYIKTMQEEIHSLRECLTENENLRLKNQRLQDEINSLRMKQSQRQELHHSSNILLTTNTTSNNNNNNNNNNSNSNHNSDNSDCEITLNSLNSTYADVQLFATSTNPHQTHHHLSDIVGLTTTTNSNAISMPSAVNVTYAKRKLIITDYVD